MVTTNTWICSVNEDTHRKIWADIFGVHEIMLIDLVFFKVEVNFEFLVFSLFPLKFFFKESFVKETKICCCLLSFTVKY